MLVDSSLSTLGKMSAFVNNKLILTLRMYFQMTNLINCKFIFTHFYVLEKRQNELRINVFAA